MTVNISYGDNQASGSSSTEPRDEQGSARLIQENDLEIQNIEADVSNNLMLPEANVVDQNLDNVAQPEPAQPYKMIARNRQFLSY